MGFDLERYRSPIVRNRAEREDLIDLVCRGLVVGGERGKQAILERIAEILGIEWS